MTISRLAAMSAPTERRLRAALDSLEALSRACVEAGQTPPYTAALPWMWAVVDGHAREPNNSELRELFDLAAGLSLIRSTRPFGRRLLSALLDVVAERLRGDGAPQ